MVAAQALRAIFFRRRFSACGFTPGCTVCCPLLHRHRDFLRHHGCIVGDVVFVPDQ